MEFGITPSKLLNARERKVKLERAWPKFCGNLPDRLFFETDNDSKEEIVEIEIGNSPEK